MQGLVGNVKDPVVLSGPGPATEVPSVGKNPTPRYPRRVGSAFASSLFSRVFTEHDDWITLSFCHIFLSHGYLILNSVK